MADQPTTPSGSRWEPDPDREPTTESPAGAVRPTEADAGLDIESASAGVPGEPVAKDRRTTVRGRAVVAGAATALVLGGGVVGFGPPPQGSTDGGSSTDGSSDGAGTPGNPT